MTYARRGRDWFVVSGLVNDRIYYQRTVLSKACATINTLVIEYPTVLRRSLARAITVMSRSFRPGGRPARTVEGNL
ncbi:MAG TPA: hypothetical protein VJ770_25135 [Stellaceae bacterium]|nr:hypothetical protein [Stellaceae bacterium]